MKDVIKWLYIATNSYIGLVWVSGLGIFNALNFSYL